MPVDLTHYDAACRELEEAVAVDEVKGILDKTVAIEAYARQVKDHGLEIKAAKIRVRAERRIGQLTAEMRREGLLHRGRHEEKPKSSNGELLERVMLRDLGIDKKLSLKARRLAELPDEQFEGLLTQLEAEAGGDAERIARGVLKMRERAGAMDAHAVRAEGGCSVENLNELAGSGKTFKVILADPPWRFETWSVKGEVGAPKYPTEDARTIANLPVTKLAATDCVLFLWHLDTMIPEAINLIEGWGFELKTRAFDWTKTNADGSLFMGRGWWTRQGAESCFLATRGAPKRLDAGVMQTILAPLQEHSRKPDEIYRRIERLVAGPYLELYGRRVRPGWWVWGDEIAREDFREPEEIGDKDEVIDLPRFIEPAPVEGEGP